MKLHISFESGPALSDKIPKYHELIESLNDCLLRIDYGAGIENIFWHLQCMVVPKGFEHFLIRKKPRFSKLYKYPDKENHEFRNNISISSFFSRDIVTKLENSDLDTSCRIFIEEIAREISSFTYPNSLKEFNAKALSKDIVKLG